MIGTNPFLVLGAGTAICRGRDREWQSAMARIPHNHISIVGPKHIGKTVLINGLADRHRKPERPFIGSLYWDLRHNTPETDGAFYAALARRMVPTVKTFNNAYADELARTDAGFEQIRMICELLAEEHAAILFCLDGCDDLLLGSSVTRNLWDNLRALAELSSVRFVTGSRKRLRELCASQDSKTSDFWNLFQNPLSLGALSSGDIEPFLKPFAEQQITFASDAIDEVLKWTGGIPALVSALFRNVWEEATAGKPLHPRRLAELGAALHRGEQDLIQELWDDCNEQQRAFVYNVATHPNSAEVEQRFANPLIQRGILKTNGKDLTFASEAVRVFVTTDAGKQSNILSTLFGTSELFQRNIKGLLQLRLAALPEIDGELHQYIENAIDNLDKPKVPIRLVRAVMERCLALIWKNELPDGKIPETWITAWKLPDRDGHVMKEMPERNLPGTFGKQLRIVDLMTDPRRDKVTRIRRSTYVLLNGLHSVGDFGQHLEGEDIPALYAPSICFWVLQLSQQLFEDLKESTAPTEHS